MRASAAAVMQAVMPMMSKQKTLLVVAGPTAVGKTRIAVSLAKHLSTSVISADSRQCYCEMSIGTAKPTQEEQQGIRHYFIDSHSIHEPVSAGQYAVTATQWLSGIFAGHDIAVLCGGTGLYIQALCDGIDNMPGIDSSIADALDTEYKAKGLPWLQNCIAKEDPAFWAMAEQHNPARLLRALAFKRSTGESIVAYRKASRASHHFRIIKVCLDMERGQLYARIEQRVDAMMQAGLLKEAEGLYPYKELKPLQTVGYQELFDFFEEKHTLTGAVDKIKQHTRNYAKRQLTWFRRDKEFMWVDAAAGDVEEQILQLL